MNNDTGHWRWNVNHAWENFSSLFQEAELSKIVDNEFQKNHHLKSVLYFGILAIESFVNEKIRISMTQQGETEQNIIKYLKNNSNSIQVKLKSKYLSNNTIEISEEVNNILFTKYKTTRNELTHPKEKDHSIYQDLEFLKYEVDKFVQAVAELIIHIQMARNEPFPYWLTGWNFINMNGNPNWPSLAHNFQFIQSLYHTSLVSNIEELEQSKLKTIDQYRKLKIILSTHRCQPENPNYPRAPRLCKKWWDSEHTKNCGK